MFNKYIVEQLLRHETNYFLPRFLLCKLSISPGHRLRMRIGYRNGVYNFKNSGYYYWHIYQCFKNKKIIDKQLIVIPCYKPTL